jgi:hypothetical protein
MRNIISEEIKTEIDKILIKANKDGVFSWFSINDNDIGKEAYRMCKILELVNIIDKTSFELNKKGFSVIQEGGIEKFIENEKELKDLEFEKSKIDLELSKKTLKEFPKTKFRARIAYIIAIILALVQVTQWIIKLLGWNEKIPNP